MYHTLTDYQKLLSCGPVLKQRTTANIFVRRVLSKRQPNEKLLTASCKLIMALLLQLLPWIMYKKRGAMISRLIVLISNETHKNGLMEKLLLNATHDDVQHTP